MKDICETNVQHLCSTFPFQENYTVEPLKLQLHFVKCLPITQTVFLAEKLCTILYDIGQYFTVLPL